MRNAAIFAGYLIVAGSLALCPVTTYAAKDTAKHRPTVVTEILLMRHGVRSPLVHHISDPDRAAQPWPEWGISAGELSRHGEMAVHIMGKRLRNQWVGEGLIPESSCPENHTIRFITDSDQRTVATARALADEAAPGCNPEPVVIESENNPLLAPIDARSVSYDSTLAQNAVKARLTELSDQKIISQQIANAINVTGRLLGNPSWFGGPDTVVLSGKGRPRLEGKLLAAFQISDAFVMQYEQNMPVAWGRGTLSDIQAIMPLSRLFSDIASKTPYIATRESAGIIAFLMSEFRKHIKNHTKNTLPLISVIVAHDSTLAAVTGALDLHWSNSDFPEDIALPGGGLIFRLLDNGSGHYTVTADYTAQTLPQIRNLSPLTSISPLRSIRIRQTGCNKRSETCPLDQFFQQGQHILTKADFTSETSPVTIQNQNR